MTGIIYLNGKYCKASEATISIFDRGLLFGDAIYEVIPVYRGRVFFLDRHLQRLERSLKDARIAFPQVDWLTVFKELVKQNGGGDMQIYLQISRGVQIIRKHDIPAQIDPSIFAFTLHTPYPSYADKQRGLRAKIVEDIRWQHCDIKSTSMLGNVLVNDDAVSAGFNTAILTRNGWLTEGATSNVFIVDQQGVIKTPPLNALCLAGITRQIALELIKTLQLPCVEHNIPIQEVFAARELWITSTTKEIYPITQIDGHQIGKGVAGPCWQQVEQQFQQWIQSNHD